MHAARDVLFGKSAALKHADAKGAEIFGSDHIEARAGTRGGVDSLSREIEGHAKVCADDRHAGGGRDGRDSRQGADLIHELPIKGVDLFRMGKAVVGDGQIKRKDVVLSKTQVHAR